MAYNPGQDLDVMGMALKGVQLAHGLESLSKIRQETSAEKTAGDIAATSFKSSPIDTQIGDMNVNLGTKKEFDPNMYYDRLAASGNPLLIDKANKFKDERIKLEAQTQDVIKKKKENLMLDQKNNLDTLAVGLDMATTDPQAALGFINTHEKQFPDMGQTLDVKPMGGDKFQISGVGPDKKPYTQVVDKQQILQARTDANTRWTQYNENQRNADRLAAEQAKEKKTREGPEYINVTEPGTNKEGRMKVSDLQENWRRVNPQVKDDMSYQLLQIQASAADAPQTVKDQYKEATDARASAEHDFAAWAWNTYKADPLGLINSKEPIHWMGQKEPPAALMRGKARYDNDTGKWFISNGKSWIAPTPEQQKQIDSQMPKKK